jgi:ABC-type glycerol-3-phosphate transport system substrate-binding protein
MTRSSRAVLVLVVGVVTAGCSSDGGGSPSAASQAAESAQATPTAATLGAVASSISTLTDDVRVFADDIAATC